VGAHPESAPMTDTYSTLIKLTLDGETLYEDEMRPGNSVDLIDGLKLECEWIHVHRDPEQDAA
jgi:hypothetical protein